MRRLTIIGLIINLSVLFCRNSGQNNPDVQFIEPTMTSAGVVNSSGDPAIWVHPQDPGRSLILGTDYHRNGGLCLFDLSGRIVRMALQLQMPYAVDVEYSFKWNAKYIDIAAVVESLTGKLRLFVLPSLNPIDEGGIAVLEPDENRKGVAVSLYRRRPDGTLFAIIGARRQADLAGGLSVFRLAAENGRQVTATFVRQFAAHSGTQPISAIAVDDETGFLYYLDPAAGIRKVIADPDSPRAGEELALFGADQLLSDSGGIAIYKIHDGTGYILVSDPVSSRLLVYTREGTSSNPHEHKLVKIIGLKPGAGGCEVTNVPLNELFPTGLFVSRSADRNYHLYSWNIVAGNELVVAPDGQPVLE